MLSAAYLLLASEGSSRMAIGILPDITTPGDLGDEITAFLRAMRRENVSPNTILTYGTACRLFAEWMVEQGRRTDVDKITARDVEGWELALRERGMSSATVHNRHRGLQRFFSWLVEQRDDDWRSPMAKMRPPRMERYMPRVLTLDELRAILATCAGRGLEDRRDEALIRILFNTGARRAEIANLRYSPTDTADRDVNLARGTVKLFGKGRKERLVHIDDHTVDALEKYLRERRKHPDASEPWLWLGTRGRLTDSGVAQAIRRRGQLAGIADLHPHDLRHAWRHHAETAGASRETLMALGGWESDAMLRRYASTTANERAIDQARKIALGDKL
jgi:integrase/recombinase XerC